MYWPNPGWVLGLFAQWTFEAIMNVKSLLEKKMPRGNGDMPMKNENDKRSKKLTLCLNLKEHKLLLDSFQKTTCRNLGEYIRKMALAKPVRVNVRNQSLDELMSELIKLRSDLNRIAGHLDAPHERPLATGQSEGIRQQDDAEHTRILILLVSQINQHIGEGARKWLQS